MNNKVTPNSKVVKDSDILRLAHKLIKGKEEDRICHAIGRAGHALTECHKADQLKNWVCRMLGRYAFYEDWLIGHHPQFAKKKRITTYVHRDRLRPGRLAWLDWMIAECEAKESK